MSFFNAFKRIVLGIDEKPSDLQAIDDEMMFHIRSMIEDEIARGALFNEAWAKAEKSFGSLHQHVLRASNQNRKYAPMLVRGLALTAAILAVWVYSLYGDVAREKHNRDLVDVHNRTLQNWFNSEVNQLRAENTKLIQKQKELAAKPPVEKFIDFSGTVVDESQQPLADTTVLLFRKTWPNNHYRQESFTVKTDAQGKFRMPNFVPANAQYAVHISAFKDGYAFESSYQLVENFSQGTASEVKLLLKKGNDLTFVVQDEKGSPISDALIIPFARRTKEGSEHLVYFDTSAPIRRKTDDQGRVHFNYYHADDTGKVYVQVPGKKWQQCSFTINKNNTVNIYTEMRGPEL